MKNAKKSYYMKNAKKSKYMKMLKNQGLFTVC